MDEIHVEIRDLLVEIRDLLKGNQKAQMIAHQKQKEKLLGMLSQANPKAAKMFESMLSGI